MSELIVALDFDDALEALNMATALKKEISWVKIGLELFVNEGPRLIHSLKGVGFNIFLDLKLHDIPNTVRGATLACATAGADLITIHLSGGERMCRAAVNALALHVNRPKVFGVTVLTSLEESDLPPGCVSLSDMAANLAASAVAWELDGIVCSGQEVGAIKAKFPKLKCLTPGIRLEGEKTDDQRRVMAPAQAVAAGADYLVVGRPITRAADPAMAAAAILADMRNAEQNK